jgi:hypothetical protein
MSTSPAVFIAEIDPEVAWALLSRSYDRQRSISAGNVEMLKHRLANDQWVLSNDALVTSDDGYLLNAHHRLHACHESGKPITVLVMTGMNKDIFESLDLGKPRSLSDYFTAHGISNAAQRSAATNLLWALEEHGLPELQNFPRKVHPSEILDKYVQHGEENIDRALAVGARTSRRIGLLSKTNIAALTRFIEEWDPAADPENVAEFWEAVADEARKGAKDPAVSLRLALDKEYKELYNRGRKKFAGALLAWAAWRDERPLSLGDVIKAMEGIESDRDFQRLLEDHVVEENIWADENDEAPA